MLKQLLFIAVCISLSVNALSQDKTHYIKGYFGYGVLRTPDYQYSFEKQQLEIGDAFYQTISHYQMGYAREKSNGKSFEVSAFARPVKWAKVVSDVDPALEVGKIRSGDIQVQFEMKKKRCYTDQQKSTYYFGTFYNLTCNYVDFESSTSQTFPAHVNRIAGKMGIMPGTFIPQGKRLIFDLNIAVSLISVAVESRFFEDPALPLEQQRTRNVAFDMPIEVLLRMGIAYRL